MKQGLPNKAAGGENLRAPEKTNAEKGEGLRARAWRLLRRGMEKEPGIDGILVTVGLCIIALLLCVVMKDSLKTFIETLVTAMTTEAQKILTGVSG